MQLSIIMQIYVFFVVPLFQSTRPVYPSAHLCIQ